MYIFSNPFETQMFFFISGQNSVEQMIQQYIIIFLSKEVELIHIVVIQDKI